MKRLAYILGGIGLIMITAGVVIEIGENLNKERCYRLPIYYFYKDDDCSRYWNYED